MVRGTADAAIVYEVQDSGVVALCAHGPSTRPAIGLRMPRRDPAVVAAEAGAPVITEPAPSAVGASIIARLARLGARIEGALLLPIRVHARLVGMIEIGRCDRFRDEEIASLEALVLALVQKLEGGAA